MSPRINLAGEADDGVSGGQGGLGVQAGRLGFEGVDRLFEVDYLTVERAEIYVGWSRHRAVVWLWFLS